MKLLLDTHVLLWAAVDSPRIKSIRSRLLAPDNEVYFSVASLWEIAIKVSLGKLQADAARVDDRAECAWRDGTGAGAGAGRAAPGAAGSCGLARN